MMRGHTGRLDINTLTLVEVEHEEALRRAHVDCHQWYTLALLSQLDKPSTKVH